MSENAQKTIFRRVRGLLENGTRRNGNPDTPNASTQTNSFFDENNSQKTGVYELFHLKRNFEKNDIFFL